MENKFSSAVFKSTTLRLESKIKVMYRHNNRINIKTKFKWLEAFIHPFKLRDPSIETMFFILY